jgi:hypothetical protein
MEITGTLLSKISSNTAGWRASRSTLGTKIAALFSLAILSARCKPGR